MKKMISRIRIIILIEAEIHILATSFIYELWYQIEKHLVTHARDIQIT